MQNFGGEITKFFLSFLLSLIFHSDWRHTGYFVNGMPWMNDGFQ